MRLSSLASLLPGLAVVLAGACFDFDATEAGGPLGDGGSHADGAESSAGDGGPTGDGTTGDGGNDGGVDGTTSDGPVGPDAGDGGGGIDGNVKSDAPYCQSIKPDAGIFFCDDFDDHPLPGSWQSFGETNGTMTEVDAASVSAPNSLDEKTVAVGTNTTVDVALRTPLGLPTLPATLRLGFQVMPVQIDPTANSGVVLGAIDFLDKNSQRYTLGLAVNVVSGQPALVLGEQSAFSDGGIDYVQHPLPPTQPLPMNAWSDVVIEADWSSTTSAMISVTVGGVQQTSFSATIPITAASLQIGVGTSYVFEPAPVWEIRYDNVRFTAR
jgi:hypothetical protein